MLLFIYLVSFFVWFSILLINFALFFRKLIQLTLVISNARYLKLCYISNNLSGPLWSLNTWSKQKTLSTSNLDISNFCLCWTNFPIPWAIFSYYLKLFSKFPKLFLHFFSQISLFSTHARKIAANVPARMGKDSQIKLFLFFFLLNVLTQIFYHQNIQ